MNELYIPTLHTFAMENGFTGSCGAFRFKVTPQIQKLGKKEIDFESSRLHAVYWHGPLCFEKSEIEEEADFPLTEEGRTAMKSWLESNI